MAPKRKGVGEEDQQGPSKKSKKEEKEEENEELSGSEYEPSDEEASTTEEDEDPTTSESDDAKNDDDPSSSSSGSSSDDDDDDGNAEQEEEDEKKESRNVNGKCLRPLKESVDLPDLAQEHLFLDKPNSEGRCFAACIKGRVYLATDRVRLDKKIVEIVDFYPSKSTIRVNILEKALRGNYLRKLPPIEIGLDSSTDLQHESGQLANQAATVKIVADQDEKNGKKIAVASDKGRWRPSLFGSDKRWNEKDLKQMLLFVRRVWPSCVRPPSVTVPLQPPAQKDPLSEPDDNLDDLKDIEMITEKYRAIWNATVQRTDPNAAQAQKWMANTFDTWRKQYLAVTQTDRETAHREFWATINLISKSFI